MKGMIKGRCQSQRAVFGDLRASYIDSDGFLFSPNFSAPPIRPKKER